MGSKQVRCDIATLDVVDVAFAQGSVDDAATVAWGEDIPEVTQEAAMLEAASRTGQLLHHPILGMIQQQSAASDASAMS